LSIRRIPRPRRCCHPRGRHHQVAAHGKGGGVARHQVSCLVGGDEVQQGTEDQADRPGQVGGVGDSVEDPGRLAEVPGQLTVRDVRMKTRMGRIVRYLVPQFTTPTRIAPNALDSG
jgi:hypothetical protein